MGCTRSKSTLPARLALLLLASWACTRPAPRVGTEKRPPVAAKPALPAPGRGATLVDDEDDSDPCRGSGRLVMPAPPGPGAPPAELAPEEPAPASAMEFEGKEREGARECAGKMAAAAARGLRPCFERTVLSGRYDVSFVVAGDGRAAAVKVAGPSSGEPLLSCLRAMLGPLRFRRFGGPAIQVDIPVHVENEPPVVDGGVADGGTPEAPQPAGRP